MNELDAFKEEVLEHIEQLDWDGVQALIAGRHPADIAELIHTLESNDDRSRLFNLLDEETRPDVLVELEGGVEAGVLKSLSNAEISEMLEEMAPDDAADLLAELTSERSESILNLMETEDSADVRELLQYEEDTAGGIMTTDVVALPEQTPIAEALRQLRALESDEPFYVLHVVDAEGRLVGYIGLWELLKINDLETRLKALVHTDFTAATTDMDQEEVARLMAKYDLTSIPVIDPDHTLVGRITIDDVVDVLEEEASEDIFLLAGSDEAELTSTSPLRACRARLPWLLITLVTGFLSSLILKNFMADLAGLIVLTSFIPIVMAMGGNTGIQASTLMVRGLALGLIRKDDMLTLLAREVATGALMGLLCGVMIGLWASYVVSHTPGAGGVLAPVTLAATVGGALFCAMAFAAMYGAFVPIFLSWLNVDPAIAAGPFVTASNDIAALLIYYGITLSVFTTLAGAGGAPAL